MEYKTREYELPIFLDSRENEPFTKKTWVSTPEESVVISLHYHNRFEIGICNSGKGECYIGERIYPYGPGCIQIVPPNIPHRPKRDKDVQSSWIWILFNANGKKNLLCVEPQSGKVNGLNYSDGCRVIAPDKSIKFETIIKKSI